ncbi:MAG: NAD(P)-dependent oxidoreductase [Planctomycetota bacterium]|nr:NAD(P)-dependent oxidoreductase [Planctomycetota bacterium]
MTGPTGCIGSATCRWLLDHGIDRIVGFSRKRDLSRLDADYHSRVEWIAGDVTDLDQLDEAVERAQPRQIIHLAALQTPDCQAQPLVGMDVNVTGTMNLFRSAAKASAPIDRVVFASSAAVYGQRDFYPSDSVPATAAYLPPNLYGYWKVAGEGIAQAFHQQTGIPTISLRLATTYGPGRDQGLTSAPTTAIKSTALEAPYRMPYQGREHYHFVDDVAAGFGQAAIRPFNGYGVFNLRGKTEEVSTFLELLREAASEFSLAADIAVATDATSMPFVCDLDEHQTLAAFPQMPRTDLREGIRQSLRRFREQIASGELCPPSL